jgi:hypothetical protein
VEAIPFLSTDGTRSSATPRPPTCESRLDDVVLAAVAVRESTFHGRTFLEAYGVDVDGAVVVLGSGYAARGTPADRVALFASLLVRGLRAHRPLVVDVAGCTVLRRRMAAAWGWRAVFVG